MATVVTSLPMFLNNMADLFDMLDQCKPVLFHETFRNNVSPALRDAADRLRDLSESDFVQNAEKSEAMSAAGLNGVHLTLKLESFESSLASFKRTAREDKLEEVLEKGSTILGSLAGAIPVFGSFAQELVDFILGELRKRIRWQFWRR